LLADATNLTKVPAAVSAVPVAQVVFEAIVRTSICVVVSAEAAG